MGEYLAQQGINTAPIVGGGVAGDSPAPSPAPQQPQGPLPVIGAPQQPQGGAPSPADAGPAAPGAAGATPPPTPSAAQPTAAPGAGGTPIPGPAPGLADVQAQNVTAYNNDVAGGTSLAPKVSALQELAAAAAGARTGPAANDLALIRGLGAEFGINVGTDQVSQLQVMNKATNMLVTSGISGLGTPTDAKMLEVIGATPNSKMTPDAVGATVAMTYGATLYQQRLAEAAQAYVNGGGSPTQYNTWKLNYQRTAPSPLVLAMPYMPPSSFQAVYKYIKTLPASDQRAIDAQVKAMTAGQNASGQ